VRVNGARLRERLIHSFILTNRGLPLILRHRKNLHIMDEYNDDNPMPEEVRALAGSVKK
jgi:hypothetical protein